MLVSTLVKMWSRVMLLLEKLCCACIVLNLMKLVGLGLFGTGIMMRSWTFRCLSSLCSFGVVRCDMLVMMIVLLCWRSLG